MYLRIGFIVHEMLLTVDEDDVIRFDIGDANNIVITFRHVPQAERTPYYRTGDMTCQLTAECSPPTEVERILRNLSNGETPEGLNLDNLQDTGEVRVTEQGEVIAGNELVKLPSYPKSVTDFVTSCNTAILSYVDEIVKTVRWRLAAAGSHRVMRSGGEGWQYSFDGNAWFKLPTDYFGRISGYSLPRVPAEIVAEVCDLVKVRNIEPLPHTLLREAWEQRNSNPRSALVIGMTACEIGVKQSIANLIPGTEWLVENLPSPPIDRLVREYLPWLWNKSSKMPGYRKFPKDVLNAIGDGMQARNKLAHTGKPFISGKKQLLTDEQLEDLLLAIRDILWTIDYHAGHAWAVRHLRPATRDKMSNEPRVEE